MPPLIPDTRISLKININRISPFGSEYIDELTEVVRGVGFGG
jgi:hypothetical protein